MGSDPQGQTDPNQHMEAAPRAQCRRTGSALDPNQRWRADPSQLLRVHQAQHAMDMIPLDGRLSYI